MAGNMEFRIGYSDELGDMVYNVFEREPAIVKPPYVLLSREETKRRLSLTEWVLGLYKNNAPIACWWGNGDEISVLSAPEVRGRWLTKEVLRSFFNWFWSTHEKACAKANDERSYRLLCKMGFVGKPDNMIKVRK